MRHQCATTHPHLAHRRNLGHRINARRRRRPHRRNHSHRTIAAREIGDHHALELAHIHAKVLVALHPHTLFAEPSRRSSISRRCCAPGRTRTRAADAASPPRPASPRFRISPPATSLAAASACMAPTRCRIVHDPHERLGQRRHLADPRDHHPLELGRRWRRARRHRAHISAAAIISPSSAGPLLVLPEDPRKAGYPSAHSPA